MFESVLWIFLWTNSDGNHTLMYIRSRLSLKQRVIALDMKKGSTSILAQWLSFWKLYIHLLSGFSSCFLSSSSGRGKCSWRSSWKWNPRNNSTVRIFLAEKTKMNMAIVLVHKLQLKLKERHSNIAITFETKGDFLSLVQDATWQWVSINVTFISKLLTCLLVVDAKDFFLCGTTWKRWLKWQCMILCRFA